MPKGIPYIIGNEAAERFSYYGMKSILVVFMTDYLFMGNAQATDWLHSFGFAVYFLPFFGALLADILWGKYKTIITLSIVYCIGHLVLALYESQTGLAIGLSLIALGSGGIKPCVATHVGDQFTRDQKSLLDKIFGYFYIAINLGSFLATLLIPFLLNAFGPGVAFGLPGLLMLIATWVFWMGRKKFVAIPPVGWKKFSSDIFSKAGAKVVLHLSVLFLFIAVFWSLFDQTASTWVLQAKTDLMNKSVNLFGWRFDILPSQIQAVNPLMIILFTPIFAFWIYPGVNKLTRVTPLRKIGAGLFLAASSFVVIAIAEQRISDGQEVSIMMQVLAYVLLTAAEVMVSITGLEFAYTQAPPSMKSLVMGLWYFSISAGNLIVKLVNKYIIIGVASFSIDGGEPSMLQLESTQGFETGDKIEFRGDNGLFSLRESKEGGLDTIPLRGTYVIGRGSEKSWEIWDINRQQVDLQGEFDPAKAELKTYSFQGASYFYFFAILMCIFAVLFIIVALFYKPVEHIRAE